MNQLTNPTDEQELNKLIWLIRIHQNPHYRCEYRQDGLKRASVKCRGCCHSGESVKRAEKNIIDFVSSLTADRKRVALDKEEMTLRYAIQTLQDTNKEFALENLQRQLDKNLAQQEEV